MLRFWHNKRALVLRHKREAASYMTKVLQH